MDIDVEALLDEAYTDCGTFDQPKSSDKRDRSLERDRKRSRSRKRGSRERKSSRSPKRGSPRRRSPRRRSRSPVRRSRSPRFRGRRSPPRYDPRRFSPRRSPPPRGTGFRRSPLRRSPPRFRRSPSPYHRRENGNYLAVQSLSKGRGAASNEPPMTQEERDVRTVFCMQLSANIAPRDLEKFFEPIGIVQDVKLIADKNGRKSKGIAYVEFKEQESVAAAIAMSGKKLLGIPIIVQPSQAEKNRVVNQSQTFVGSMASSISGPLRLFVGSLHQDITEDMLKKLFQPYGPHELELIRDPESRVSKGYAFVTFPDSELGKKAIDQLNGFELAGRAMKVNPVIARQEVQNPMHSLDTDDADRSGTNKMELMAKLAQGAEGKPGQANVLLWGSGMSVPEPTSRIINARLQELEALAVQSKARADAAAKASLAPAQSSKSQCFLLQSMFNPQLEKEPDWDVEIRDEVLGALQQYGGAIHMFVDKTNPQGNIYVKAPDVETAERSIRALNGRYFSGKLVRAAYIPVINYNKIFPQSVNASDPLKRIDRD